MVAGVQVLGRAFSRALRQEFQASNEAAASRRSTGKGRKEAATDAYNGLSLQEAMKILNLPDAKDPEIVQKQYQHLFDVNDKQKGGSFYLQSKIVRAKERVDAEFSPTEPPNSSEESQTESQTQKQSQEQSQTDSKNQT